MTHPLCAAMFPTFLSFAAASSDRAEAGWTDLGPEHGDPNQTDRRTGARALASNVRYLTTRRTQPASMRWPRQV